MNRSLRDVYVQRTIKQILIYLEEQELHSEEYAFLLYKELQAFFPDSATLVQLPARVLLRAELEGWRGPYEMV